MSTKELLEKQLQLLSERSKMCNDEALPPISEAMAKLAQVLILLG